MADEKFPEGKLNEHDEGELAVAFSIEKGKVCMDFGKPTEWLAMNPDMAADMGTQLIRLARKAGCKRPITITVMTGIFNMNQDYSSAHVDFLDREDSKIKSALMYPITRIVLNDFKFT